MVGLTLVAQGELSPLEAVEGQKMRQKKAIREEHEKCGGGILLGDDSLNSSSAYPWAMEDHGREGVSFPTGCGS